MLWQQLRIWVSLPHFPITLKPRWNEFLHLSHPLFPNAAISIRRKNVSAIFHQTLTAEKLGFFTHKQAHFTTQTLRFIHISDIHQTNSANVFQMLMPAKRFQRIFKNCQRKRGELRHMFTKSRAELAQDRMMRMMRINPSNAPTTSTAPFHHTSTSPVSCSSPLSENCEEIQILSPCPSEEASPMNEKPTEQHAELPSTSVQPNENGQETSVVEKRKQSELDETLNSRIEEPSAKRPKTVSSPVEGHKENGNPKADRRLNGSFKKMAPTVRSGINVSNGTENNCASSNRRKSDDNMPASIEELFSF